MLVKIHELIFQVSGVPREFLEAPQQPDTYFCTTDFFITDFLDSVNEPSHIGKVADDFSDQFSVGSLFNLEYSQS